MNKLTLALVLLCWTGLALGDFPLPMSDDLYFIGAALNMVHGGSFSNPTCPSLAVLGAEDPFFAYMPFHSYALLAWLKLTGVSRHAFVIFQAMAGAAACLALIDLLKPAGGVVRQSVVAAGVTLAVMIVASGVGLRPDLLALALFACGAHLIRARSLPACFGTGLLLFFSVMTSPNFACLVLILFGLSFWSRRHQAGAVLLKRAVVVALAGFTAFLVFLCLIDFQLHTFLTVFNRVRQSSTFSPPYPTFSANVWVTVQSLTYTIVPAIVSILVPLLAFPFSSATDKPNGRTVFMGFLASGMALIFSSYQSGAGITFLILNDLVVLLFIFGHLRTDRATACFAPILGVAFTYALLHRGRHLLLFFLQPFLPLHNQVPAYLAQIAKQQPTAIYLDSAAAAELYDYRLPLNACDAIYGYKGRWDQAPPARDLPVGTVFVVASWMTEQLGFKTGVQDSSEVGSGPPSSVPGLRSSGPKSPANPYQLIFVTVSRDSSSQNVFQSPFLDSEQKKSPP